MKSPIRIFSILLLFCANLAASPYIELGPMLGHVGEDTASIWFKATGTATPSIVIGQRDDLSDGVSHPSAVLTPSNEFMGSITITDLAAESRYVYAVALDGRVITPRPFPTFTTASRLGSAGHLRIAFSSCLGGKGVDAAAAWAQMDASSDADLVLLLGDNHYADTTARDGQTSAYFSNRSSPGFRAIGSHLPIYGIWDDHDYGPNDSDGSADGKERSLETFKQFWPNPAYGEVENPGIYYKFTRGEVEFFMLDVRYHRSPDKMIDDGTKTMLGAGQLAWLKDNLKASKAKIKIIASGSEWQRHSHADSWSSYPRERDAFFDFLKEGEITGILLISGDRHFTGGYQIGGEFIEVTAGPLGARNFPTKNLPEMFFNKSEGKLYAVFDIDTTGGTPKVSVEAHRPGDGIVHNQELPWAAILGQQQLETLPIETTPEKAPYQISFAPENGISKPPSETPPNAAKEE